MKIKRPLILKNFLLIISLSFLLFIVESCARKVTFLTSTAVPAARGTVKVKKDNNNNYAVKIHLSNLAEPGRLQPAKKNYVVWMVTDRDITKNLGQIKTSSGIFSKKLKSSFETVSSFKPVKIFITAENDPDLLYPGMQVVLSTNRF